MGARLLLLRHGQIKANRQQRWHGSTDSPLTWRGRRQARKTGQHLSNRELHAIYSSPLQRCQATAAPTAQYHELEVQIHDDLAEMDIGEWEDLPYQQLAAEHDLFNHLNTNPDFCPPGGESLRQVAQRTLAAIQSIDANHDDDETVLVVSHGVVMATLISQLLEGSLNLWGDYLVHNCSLSEFELSPEPTLHTFNQHAHL